MFRIRLSLWIVIAIGLWLHPCAANDDLDAGYDAVGRHDYTNAITHLTQAIDSGELSQRQMLLALEARSGTRIEMGQWDLALADCELALSIDADHGPTLINRAIV
jgi:hypothetical protein